MSSTESVTFAAQIAALFVIALSASGFLVLAHFLGPLGIPATILTKTQLLAAGFSYIITIVLSPAVSCGLAFWFAAGERQNTVRVLLFIGFTILLESLILDHLFPSISGKIAAGSTGFLLAFLIIVTFLYACTMTQIGLIARKLSHENSSKIKGPEQIKRRKTRQFKIDYLKTRVILGWILSLFYTVYLFLLWRISKEAVLIIIFLCTMEAILVILASTFRYSINNKFLFSVALALYFFFGMILSNLTYFKTDSAWGGAGHVYAELTLEQRSGLLAPCTWPVRIVAESDSEYYVTLIPETKTAFAYSIPKSKTSGLHLYSLKEETATTTKSINTELPLHTSFESDECKHIRLDPSLVPPH